MDLWATYKSITSQLYKFNISPLKVTYKSTSARATYSSN